MPNLSNFCAGFHPSIPFSTTNAVIPPFPAAGSVLAYTMTVSATVPLVIHIFVPSRRHPPSTRVAFVRIDTTSLPAPGSDMASAPTASPAMRGGSRRAAWAGVALRTSWETHRLEWAPYERATAPDARDSSSMATAWAA